VIFEGGSKLDSFYVEGGAIKFICQLVGMCYFDYNLEYGIYFVHSDFYHKENRFFILPYHRRVGIVFVNSTHFKMLKRAAKINNLKKYLVSFYISLEGYGFGGQEEYNFKLYDLHGERVYHTWIGKVWGRIIRYAREYRC
jgi:hypothetical protein